MQNKQTTNLDTTVAKILARTTATDSGCWEYEGWIGNRGYGSTSFRGRTIATHRLVASLFIGDVVGKVVCHSCDNRTCCNPDHLWIGTQADNNWDAVAKGRAVNPVLRGEQNGRARLTEHNVHDIRRIYKPYDPVHGAKPLGELYRVTPTTIRDIATRKSWDHIR